ncbi:hypothetical protein [Rahnella laticis]|uniref:hypothetical protein n=1 Tax=Rahnella laticis TaxID=2787622 RepID=UPI0018A2C6D9|nr:hypothetical protein [Rahnella laticis]MBF7994991.1 hypothetical protein [Rahnella laticis]
MIMRLCKTLRREKVITLILCLSAYCLIMIAASVFYELSDNAAVMHVNWLIGLK